MGFAVREIPSSDPCQNYTTPRASLYILVPTIRWITMHNYHIGAEILPLRVTFLNIFYPEHLAVEPNPKVKGADPPKSRAAVSWRTLRRMIIKPDDPDPKD